MIDKVKIQILNMLATKFTKEQAKNFVANEIAKDLFGTIPDYSTRQSYHILPVNTTTVSVFSICFFKDNIIFLKNRYGKLVCPGGFVKIDINTLEQPRDAMAREFEEEVCDNKGDVIISLNKQRFVSFDTYIDYRKFDMDLTPTVNIAYVVELTEEEYLKVLRHQGKCVDKKYAEEVQFATNNEIYGIEIVSVTEVDSNKFAHPNEFKAVCCKFGLL